MNRTERRDRCRATAMSRRSPVVQAIAAAALLGLLSGTDANAAFSDETGARLPSSSDKTYTLAVGDVDGGGDDLLVVNNGQLGLLVNDGNGVFSDVTLQLPSQSVAALGAVIADLDGDTDNDIFVANALGPNLLLINNGAGTFADESAARLPGGSSASVHVAVGDVDGDGDRDLVVANRNGQNQLLLNNGAGVFVDGTTGRLPVDNDPSQGVVLFDANGDGGLDLFVANQGAQDRILINNKVGVFTDETALRLAADPTTDSFKAVALDANGDGRLDLAIAGGGAGARLLLQDAGGAGTFFSAALPTASEFTIDIAAGDIDFDGSTDLFLANAGQDRVLLNDGTGTFTDDTVGQLPVDTDRTFGVALFDFDGDFDLDQVLARHMDGNTGGGAPNLALRNVIAAPRVLVAVAPNYIEQTDSFSVVAQVADDGPFDAPVLQVVGPNAGDLAATSGVVPCAEGPPLTWTCPSSALTLPFGSYTATVDVQDQEVPANIGQRVVNFVVVEEDLEPPSIDVFTATPQATPLVIGQTISVQVEASDPPLVSGADGSGVDSLIVTANGANVPLDSSGNAVFVTNGTGPLDIVTTATDAAGNSVFQTQSFNVEPDTTPPSVNTFTVTPGTVNLLESATIQVDAVDDVVVSNIHVVVTDPNASTQEFDIDGTLATLSGIFEYIAYVPGTHTVDVTVSDGASNTATAQSTFEGVGTPDTTPPTVSVSVSPATVPVGANTTISVVASDDVLVQSLTLTVNDTPVALDGANQAVYAAPIVGTFNVVATATDPTGQ